MSFLETFIKENVGEVNRFTWFGLVRPLREGDGILTVGVPDVYTKDWIAEHYLDKLETAYSQFRGSPSKVVLEIDKSIVLEEDKSATLPQTSAAPSPSLHGLNPRYTFERFVVGAGNQFAAAAAKAVADLPGGHYNPLFIYGGVGLGKTHLINAIGLALLQKFPQARVYYLTAERFVNEVIEGIRYDKMPALRAKYRNSCDVFLIDDVQFIAGKDRSQEEFFHTFNTLYFDLHKQIVLTSDRFPKEMQNVEDRLRSRFEWGLIADIQPPDLETRVAILKKKAELSQIELSDDVALWLASKIRSNVRELEGSLIRLSAYASVDKKPITVEYAEKILSNLTKETPARLTIEFIQKAVAEYFKIHLQDIKSARRLKTISLPRQIAMYLARKHTTASFPEIGQKFGGKDHSTVIHAFRKMEGEVKNNPQMTHDISELEKKILS